MKLWPNIEEPKTAPAETRTFPATIFSLFFSSLLLLLVFPVNVLWFGEMGGKIGILQNCANEMKPKANERARKKKYNYKKKDKKEKKIREIQKGEQEGKRRRGLGMSC